MSKYDDLVKKLKEIFQIDRPELDFGIYRIFNTRAAEINHYLEHRLKAKMNESLAVSGAANLDGLQRELAEKEAQYRADGIDPATVPKLQEIKQKLAQYNTGASEHENAVFSHLLTFFSRYYDKGDFISQRRYKGDTYAIPYAGEEVVLHWANKDQYYIKSSESFSNYAFKLDDGRTVRFRLVTADTAKDNRKDNNKERRFVLIEPRTRELADEDMDDVGAYNHTPLFPVTEENGELVLRFEYKAMPKNTPESRQEKLLADAINTILNDTTVKTRWLALSQREPTEKNPHRTLLEKHLTQYTTRNTADYFIHKDLGRFLRNELDFYIKNEVMHLDDVQHAEKFADIERNLRLIQTLRAIALDLIAFLAQLEDFQKKLWLKKKFVVATHYCITLDRIPESLYPTIAANARQWEQWEKLGMLGEHKTDLFNQAKTSSIEYLKAHPYLMADTALYDAELKGSLLTTIDDLDDSLDGLLIHGDNFQALNLLQERYRERVKCIYIDPPYNTGEDEFAYKDSYQHSSWLSMIYDRIVSGRKFVTKDAAILASVDETEQPNFRLLFDAIWGLDNFVADMVWAAGRKNDSRLVSVSHEYMLIYAYSREFLSQNKIEWRQRKKGLDDIYIQHEKLKRKYGIDYSAMTKALKQWFKDLPESHPAKAHKHYSFVDKKGIYFPDNISWPGGGGPKYEVLHPITGKPVKIPSRGWMTGDEEKMHQWIADDLVHFGENEESVPCIKSYLKDREYQAPYSVFYQDGRAATKRLRHLLGRDDFGYPKDETVISESITMVTSINDLVLDYFAGSGTTAHAVINLNRQDNGKRKYILVEQGEYFDTVLKPRIQKVVYSADWKDGKATAPETGISHAFKVLKLESYEDTLNNLQLRRNEAQQSLLDSLPPSAREDYLLRYMLDIESRDSLLSVEQFHKPFDCALKVTVDSAGAYEERSIDLVETFNYLIGLRVKHIDMQREQGFVAITGWLPSGEKTLVLWRDVERVDYEALNRLCGKLAINPADSEFDVVYINGDHNIPAVFTSTEAEGGITKTLKIRQIEAEFLNRMFAVDGTP